MPGPGVALAGVGSPPRLGAPHSRRWGLSGQVRGGGALLAIPASPTRKAGPPRAAPPPRGRSEAPRRLSSGHSRPLGRARAREAGAEPVTRPSSSGMRRINSGGGGSRRGHVEGAQPPCASRFRVPEAPPCGERPWPCPTRLDGRAAPPTQDLQTPQDPQTSPDPPGPAQGTAPLSSPHFFSAFPFTERPPAGGPSPGPARRLRPWPGSLLGTLAPGCCSHTRRGGGGPEPQIDVRLGEGGRSPRTAAHRPFPCRCPEAPSCCSPPCSWQRPFQPPWASGHR